MESFRPKPFYFINTAAPADLTREACREAMRALAEAGFGGCVLFNKPPTGFDEKCFLSDFWFETLENFIVAGREFGLELWLNDGFDYPPGDAAGRIAARDSTLHQERLVLNAKGEAEPVRMAWGYPAFELPESSELFIELVYEAHRKRLERYFGNGLYGFFSDCDNRRINAFVLKNLEDGQYFPWSRNFSAEFGRRHGYAVEPYLADILRGEAPERPTLDYWRTAGELYQAWFANNHAWCRAHGLHYTFHTSDTGPLTMRECRRASLFSEGDPFTLFQHSDCPGTDHEIALLDGGIHYDARYRVPVKCWGTPGRAGYRNFADTRHDVRAKYAASASFMQRAPRTMCEMFAATNFGTDFQELRRIAMWQIMMGVNFIVPHAVHHRFFGTTKYFAPPEFLHGTLRDGLREFNAMLAEACRIASQGTLCAPVALVDPAEAVWRGDENASQNLLALCDRLNRSAVGYVVVSRAYLAEHRDDFALAVDPADWDGTLELAGLPGGEVHFSGGELGYMRRRHADGSEFLIACNLWSDRELSGSLRWRDQDYVLALAPGEYAVLGGPDERFRPPAAGQTVLTLPMFAEAEFAAPQRIPLDCPKREDGERREFVWRNRGDAGPLLLEWPEVFAGVIECDGAVIRPERRMRFFDDPYVCAELPADASAPGEHRLVFDGPAVPQQSAHLCGRAEVALWTEGTSEKTLAAEYNLALHAPKRYTMELAPRRRRLRLGTPLSEQGELFYEGKTIWTWRFTLDRPASLLDFRGSSGVCDVVLDGVEAGRRIAEPYLMPLTVAPGCHELKIVLYGSLGALLEGGNAEVRLAPVIRLCE